MSNNLSWNVYLFGNQQTGTQKVVGLIPKLSQRIGMLMKLKRFMDSKQFKMTCDGLFHSTLLYCIPLFVNTWGLPTMDDTMRKSTAFSKEDCRRLQVLQNKVLRSLTGEVRIQKSTESLVNEAKVLSVHQLGAYHTLITTARILQSKKPAYLSTKLTPKKHNQVTIVPARQQNVIDANCKLSVSRCGFVYRAAKLWNCLPLSLRCEMNMEKFKRLLKIWIKEFIRTKPP